MRMFSVAVFTLLCVGTPGAKGATIFVDASLATGAGDGSSWADAFQGRFGLVAALAAAGESDEVWVADGVYAPAPPNSDKELSFNLPGGVAILGGFAGGETSADQRDPAANVATLTGDLNGDDGPPVNGIAPNSFDNAHHVLRFTGPGAAVIDGVTIRDGRADSFADQTRGAGVLATGGSLTLRDCRFGPSWSSWQGGGVSCENGSLIVDRCVFSGTRADMGGAVAVLTGGTALITDTDFLGNIGGLGGAVFVGPLFFNGPVGGGVEIRRCRFEGGDGVVGSSSGGALYFSRAIQAEVEDCDFIRNFAVGGGGAVFIAECEAFFDRCQFVGNEAPGDGGGAVYVIGNLTFDDEGLARAVFSNSRFVGNNGASLSISGGIAEYLNCTFANNSLGDAFLTWPVFFTSFQNGATICRNTIIWDNGELPTIAGAPIFAGSLAQGSAAVDATDPALLVFGSSLDLANNPRIADDPCAPDLFGALDLGAYERQITGACAADLTCDGVVDVDDLNAVLAGWIVSFDVDDLNAVLSNWRQACN